MRTSDFVDKRRKSEQSVSLRRLYAQNLGSSSDGEGSLRHCPKLGWIDGLLKERKIPPEGF